MSLCNFTRDITGSPFWPVSGIYASRELRLNEFTVEDASDEEDPELYYKLSTGDERRSGFHATVFPRPNHPWMIKRFHWKIDLKVLVVELNGLRKAGQLVKCVRHRSIDGSIQYFIYMKRVLEHGLAEVESMVAAYRLQNKDGDPYAILHDKIREKAIEYAVNRRIGHRDIQRKNIRIAGSSLENLVVDLVDWSTWEDFPEDEQQATIEIEQYVGNYLNRAVQQVIKDLPLAPKQSPSPTNDEL